MIKLLKDVARVLLFIIAVAFLALAACSVLNGQEVAALAQEVEPGTILAVRNPGGRRENRVPLYWNHIAIMGDEGQVIEADADRGVSYIPYRLFYSKYGEIIAFEIVPKPLKWKLVLAAKAQLGQPYRPLTNNCVTLVRESVNLVTDIGYGWHMPSDVVRCKREVLWHKEPVQ